MASVWIRRLVALLLLVVAAPGAYATCSSADGIYIRYVKFRWLGGTNCSTGYLNVAELQVVVNGSNVALSKPATAFDFLSGNSLYEPGKINDGSSTTFYHSASINSSSYVQVDLLVSCPGVRLLNSSMTIPSCIVNIKADDVRAGN